MGASISCNKRKHIKILRKIDTGQFVENATFKTLFVWNFVSWRVEQK